MLSIIERRAYQRRRYAIRRQKLIDQGIRVRRYVFQRNNQVFMNDPSTWRKHKRGDLWSYWKGGD